MAVNPDNLVWIDMEMTGLDPDHDLVLEMATIVTDSQLNIIAEGPCLTVHQTEERMAQMDEWNTKHHGESGLTARVIASTTTEAMAEAETLEFLADYVGPRDSPLCGNSIGQDRRFIDRHMPNLGAFFHYRNLDVSAIKVLVMRWKPEIMDLVIKQGKHRALDDIRESIDELKVYRANVFKI
ncbi:MAG: oligoribonuclease [Pseudomonadales bacterium]|mgnify:FL=1